MLRQVMTSVPAGATLELEPVLATDEGCLAVHPERYLRALEAACAPGPAYIDPAPTFVTPGSLTAAHMAAVG